MVRQTVREFVTTSFYVADAAGFSDDASLFESGIIDSTGVLEIIGFLEQRFGIHVEDEDIVPANFDSVAGITAFVTRKRSGPDARPQPA